MPLTPSISIAQSSADWANLTFTDTSAGSDGNITSRIIFIQKANDEYLSTVSTDYIPWALADTSIDVNGLIDRDYSLLITVQWLNVDGDILYTVTNLYLFYAYNKNELIGIYQGLTAKPNIVQDRLYWLSLCDLMLNKNNAELATEYVQQVMSQAAIQRNTFLLSNQITYF